MGDHYQEMTLEGLSGGAKGSGSGNHHEKGDKKQKKIKPATLKTYKYTTQDKGLAEAIYLLSEGKSKFLLIEPDTDEPILADSINAIREIFAIIKPQDVNGSNPNRSLITPYVYENEEEIRRLIQIARKLDISDLFSLVEYVWNNTVVTKDKQLITLLTNYTLFSYFQDQFETVHYILLTGLPGWGKGAILFTFKLLGYRVVMAGDMSGANLLDLLGTLEFCQISLAEDELDNLDKDEKKLRIYKMGYEDGPQVPRTFDAGSSNRSLKTYPPFGCKMFVGEHPPDSKVLGGFNDRTLRDEVKKGKARFMVKRIKKQMEKPVEKQSPKYRVIIERINFIHKILLIYRLLHQNDEILKKELPLNIFGRALELCGPSIQLYHTLNNKADNDPDKYKIRNRVMDCLGHYLRKKGELDKKTMEGILHNILDGIFDEMDADNDKIKAETDKKDYNDLLDGSRKTSYVVSYDEICNRFIKEVDGAIISARTFECADFGKVTHDRLISRCREVFGGLQDNIGRDKGKRKALGFDRAAVKEVGKNFDIISEIKIVDKDESFEDTDEEKKLWSRFEFGSRSEQEQEQEQEPEPESEPESEQASKTTNSTVEPLSSDSNDQSSTTETDEHISLAMGTNPVLDPSENEGFATDEQEQTPHVSLVMGTRGLIQNHMDENDQKVKGQDEPESQDSQNSDTNNKNILTNEPSNDNTHFPKSNDNEINRDLKNTGLVPTFLEKKENEEVRCDLRNQEGADKFTAEVERLGKKGKEEYEEEEGKEQGPSI